jgi:hypothetical protein
VTICNSPFGYAADWINPVSAACIAARLRGPHFTDTVQIAES